jgi:hypothetical protein
MMRHRFVGLWLLAFGLACGGSTGGDRAAASAAADDDDDDDDDSDSDSGTDSDTDSESDSDGDSTCCGSGLAWSAGPSLPLPRRSHAVLAHDGHLYSIGGIDGTTIHDGVYVSPILADGTLGAWRTTTPLSDNIDGHAAVVARGAIYVLGSDHSAGDRSSVRRSCPRATSEHGHRWRTCPRVLDGLTHRSPRAGEST